MQYVRLAALGLALSMMVSIVACAREETTFAQERAKVRTTVGYASSDSQTLPKPPKKLFQKVTYASPIGQLGAYLTPDPGDGAKHPAIIWITGGESNTVGDVWSPQPRDNDQNATAYRQAGVVMMFPSLRGGNVNPGQIEGMFGEIDDILAAADFLARQPYVDPARIYLGGHSTGGTLVLLTAEASDRFRAVFAFGPAARATNYPPTMIPIDFKTLPPWEERLRAPIEWLPSVKDRLFVIEATDGNIETLRDLRKASHNSKISFVEVAGADHFSVLAPANSVLARKILADTGEHTNITLSATEIQDALAHP